MKDYPCLTMYLARLVGLYGLTNAYLEKTVPTIKPEAFIIGTLIEQEIRGG